MRDDERKVASGLLDAEVQPVAPDVADAQTWPAASDADGRRASGRLPETLPPSLAHPIVLIDPRPLTYFAVQRLRARGVPVHVLAEHRFEPSLHARGVRGSRLPPLRTHPQGWRARLLELAALVEPRPVVVPCSRRARAFLRAARGDLHMHYDVAPVEVLRVHDGDADEISTERALRRTILRGEPAFEVQVAIDAQARCIASCILTWVAGVPPELVVSSVESDDIEARSLEWLRRRQHRGYARLIWAPDRFGRLELQAAGTLPGSGWVLALQDGVDLPFAGYACLAGVQLPEQCARRELALRFRVVGLDAEEMTPLVPDPIPSWRCDPLARLARWVGCCRR